MTLVLNGTTGVSAVDGSASTPAIQGNDTNTGMFFPAADTIAFAEGGTEVMRIDSSGNLNLTTGGSALQWSNASNNCYIAASSGILQFATGTAAFVERMRIAADGSRSSVIPSGNTLYPAFDCRAWVNFNGTGTVAIRASGNVSSITDNGTGDYTVNFTTAMVDANFAATGSAGGVAGANPRILGINNRTTSAVRVSAGQSTLQDESEVSVAIFR